VALQARRDGCEVGHNVLGGRGSIPHSGDRSDGMAPRNGDSTGAALHVVDPNCAVRHSGRAPRRMVWGRRHTHWGSRINGFSNL